jgi:hypothetical protein
MEILIYSEPSSEPLGRSVHLTNDEWLVLSQTLESFSTTYRDRQSILIATYVTRGQLDQAVIEAKKMNEMLHKLDILHAKIV